MATPVRDIASGTAKTASGLREIIQDLVAPDLRAIKVSVDGLAQEIKLRTDALAQEIKTRTEALSNEMKLRHEGLQEELRMLRDEMRLRDENQGKMLYLMATDIKSLAQKFDLTNDLRERIASIEARMPRQ
jgi:hypothetical protein